METPKFEILCCNNYKKEVQLCLKELNIEDPIIHTYPAVCGSKRRKNIVTATKNFLELNKNIEVIGCLKSYSFNGSIDECADVCIEKDDSCFDYVFQPAMNKYYMEQGYFLVTPGWLLNWKFYINEFWQFNQEQAVEFFKESANSFLLLDTQVDKNSETLIRELSDYVDLPYSILPIGLDYLKQKIEIDRKNWQIVNDINANKKKANEFRKEKADYVFTFQITQELAKYTNRDQIINKSVDLFNIVFSPDEVTFVDFSSTEKEGVNMNSDYEIHQNKDGFKLIVKDKNKVHGYFNISRVKFVENLSEYINLGLFTANIIGLSLFTADLITELKLNLNEVGVAKKQLEDADNDKKQLFSIIAHDLRSPMGSIAGILDFLKGDFNILERDELYSLIEQIDQSAQKLNLFLIDMLNWARTQLDHFIYNPSQIEIDKAVNFELEIMNNLVASKNIDIHLNIENATCYADLEMFKIVFRNLVSNAIKFSYQNGRIDIECVQQNGYTQLSIRDYGVGMSTDEYKQLFKKIFSNPGTKNEMGTGLGLATSLKLVEKNNGNLRVESELNVGTTFRVYLPTSSTETIS